MLAGVAGFEPTNSGVKVRCLTTWRHPIQKHYSIDPYSHVKLFFVGLYK